MCQWQPEAGGAGRTDTAQLSRSDCVLEIPAKNLGLDFSCRRCTTASGSVSSFLFHFEQFLLRCMGCAASSHLDVAKQETRPAPAQAKMDISEMTPEHFEAFLARMPAAFNSEKKSTLRLVSSPRHLMNDSAGTGRLRHSDCIFGMDLLPSLAVISLLSSP